MNWDWKAIGEKTIIGVVSAGVLAVLAWLWNWGSGGGIVRALGGVSKAELSSFQTIPAGAVMAFDLPTGCPVGWSTFQRGISRMIIGASATGLSVADVPNLDVNDQRLRPHSYQSTGGEEKHTLTVAELPPHSHGIQILQHSEYLRENRGYQGTDSVGRDAQQTDPKWAVRYTEIAGNGQAHNVMPPFIALFYCKKD